MMGKLNRFRVSLTLSCISVILWILSLFEAKVQIGFYGLIHSFPLTFFVSSGLLSLSFFILITHKHKCSALLLMFQLCLLNAMLLLSPLVIGGVGYSGQALVSPFQMYGSTEYLLRRGSLSPELLWYHSFPLTWIYCMTLISLLGLTKPDLLIGLAPFLWQVLYLLPLSLLFKYITEEEKESQTLCFGGLWIFSLSQWLGQNFLGAQGFGYFFFLLLIALVIRAAQSPSTSMWLIILLICFSLVITHLLSSLVALMILSSLVLMSLFKRRTHKVATFILVLSFAVLELCWLMYWAVFFFQSNLGLFFSVALRIDLLLRAGIFERASGESHRMIVLLRILDASLFLVLALIGFLRARKLHKYFDANLIMVLIPLCAASMAVLPGIAYGSELVQRQYLFALPSLSYFVAKLLHSKKLSIVLLIILIAAFPLHLVARYGNAKSDSLTAAYLTAAYTFHDITKEGYVLDISWTEAPQNIFGFLKNQEKYTIFSLRRSDVIDFINKYNKATPLYISLSRHDYELYSFIYDDKFFIPKLKVSMDNMTNVNLAYQNGDVSLYLVQGNSL